MRHGILVAVSLLALVAGGCSLLDSFFGVGPNGEQMEGGGPSGVVGAITNNFIPGSMAVITGLGGLWAAIRGRSWRKATEATFDVIEAGAKAGKSVKDLKAELKVAHSAAGVAGVVKKVVDKYGHASQPPPAPAT